MTHNGFLRRMALTLAAAALVTTWAAPSSAAPFPYTFSGAFGKGQFFHFTFSPKGDIFAVSSSSGVFLFDTKSFEEQKSVLAQKGYLSFDKKGKKLSILGLNGALNVVDLEKGEELMDIMGNFSGMRPIVFAPGGASFAYVSAKSTDTVGLRKVLGTTDLITFTYPGGAIYSLAFSADGGMLAVGGKSGEVVFLDTKTGAVITTVKASLDTVQALAFSPKGKTIAVGTANNTVSLWNTGTFKETFAFTKLKEVIRAVAFSPDGALLASGGNGQRIRLFDVAGLTQDSFIDLGADFTVDQLGFSPKGKKLVAWMSNVNEESIRVYSLPSKKVERIIRGFVPITITAMMADPINKWVATGTASGDIRLWNRATGEVEKILVGHTGTITGLAHGSKDDVLVSGSEDGTVRLWDMSTGKQKASSSVAGKVTAMAVDTIGKLIAVGSPDGDVHILDTNALKPLMVLEGHTDVIRGLAFDFLGEHVYSTSDDGTIRIWPLDGGPPLQIIDVSPASPGPIAVSPDGDLIATGDRNMLAKNKVRIFDVSKSEEIAAMPGHSEYISSLVFTPEGGHLVTGSWDKTIKVWDVASKSMVSSFELHKSTVSSIVITADGKTMLTADDDGRILLFVR